MAKLKNLTPHKITLLNGKGEVMLELPKCERPARAKVSNVQLGLLELDDGKTIKLNSSRVNGTTENLPEPEEGVFYIVSFLVCRANPDRGDLLIVDEIVRDEEGNVVGAKALSKNPFYNGDESSNAFNIQ